MTTLAQAIEDFSAYIADYRRLSPGTVYEYGRDLLRFRLFLGRRFDVEPAIEEIDSPMILEFLLEKKWTPATIRRRRSTLGSMFRYLQVMGIVRANPALLLPLPKSGSPLPKAIAKEDVGRLLAYPCIFPYQVIVLRLMVGAGLRVAEVCSLRFDDVDMEGRSLHVRGKGDKERSLPLTDKLVGAIAQYLPQRGGERKRRHFRKPSQKVRRYVLPLDGGIDDLLVLNHEGGPLTPHAVYDSVKKLARRAGLDPKKISPHVFRHTFATELVRAGVNIRTVQELLGHADLSTTARYLAVDMEQKRSAVAVLDKAMAAVFA